MKKRVPVLLILVLLLIPMLALGNQYRRTIPIILAEFQDQPFGISQDYADSVFKRAEKYFLSQIGTSDSISFTLGPKVSLSAAQDGSNVALAVAEACRLADGELNYSHFSVRSGKELECVCVVFSGSRIWPRQYQLSKDNVFVVLDGSTINGYMAISEFFGEETFGTGLLCHEFAHILGLPDFYDTDGEGSGGTAKGLWGCTALMDLGETNDLYSNPAGFGAPDYHTLGLGHCDTLKVGEYRLEPISESHRYLWYPADMEGEYYLFECRKPSGWDSGIGGAGMLIYHVDQSKNRAGFSTYYNITLTAEQRWSRNQINCRPDHQCMDLVEAYSDADSVNAVFFPYVSGQNFASDTDPAFRFWSGKAASLALRDIRMEADSSVSFKVIEPIRNGKEFVFQKSAILDWEIDKSLLEECDSCSASWYKDGKECFHALLPISPSGKAYHNIDGLQPDSHYNVDLRLYTRSGIYSATRTVNTRVNDSRNTIPFIFLLLADRYPDGSFKIGSSFPLHIFNSPENSRTVWTFADKPVEINDEGLFVVKGSGVLRAEIFYEDGSCDVIEKNIVAK